MGSHVSQWLHAVNIAMMVHIHGALPLRQGSINSLPIYHSGECTKSVIAIYQALYSVLPKSPMSFKSKGPGREGAKTGFNFEACE